MMRYTRNIYVNLKLLQNEMTCNFHSDNMKAGCTGYMGGLEVSKYI